MGSCIGITSGKGGVGKSSVCIGLGIALARKGYKVCLVDMDLGLKNLDVMMGLENRVFYDILDIAQGKCSLAQAIVSAKNQDRLKLLPACKSVHVHMLKQEMMTEVIDELKEMFDYILLDTPAGIETGFLYTCALADSFIVVSTLDMTALQDADRIIGLLMKENVHQIKCVLNRLNLRYIDKGISVQLTNALEWLCVECIGIVYEDEQIIRGYNIGQPAVYRENSKAWECFDHICNAFLGEEVVIPKLHKSILKRLFSSYDRI